MVIGEDGMLDDDGVVGGLAAKACTEVP